MLNNKIKELLKLTISPITLTISYLTPKQKNKWIFGAWFGSSYKDNSKFLFEHLSNDNTINSIWISKNKDIVKQISDSGRVAHYKYSLKGIYHSITSGCAFYTCGPSDINELFICRTKKVQFWHGIPLKKILYDDNIRYPDNKLGRLKKKRDLLLRNLIASRRQKWDLIISSSPEVTKRLSSAFMHKTDLFLESGYPRQDKLYNSLPASKDKNLILYAPTHREEGLGYFKADDFIKKLNITKLDSILKKTNSELIVKLHHYHNTEDINEEVLKRTNIKLDKNSEIYEILKETDILITDYSSIYIDFLSLKKPIIFFCFDLKKYIEEERGLYEDFELSAPGPIVTDSESLIDQIERTLADSTIDEKITLNHEKFFTHQDNKACERITLYLKSNLNEK